jgi:hypothetical protein
MIEPTSADIGQKVIYTGNRHPGGKPEEGVITSFNNWVVFVRYGADIGSKGTDRRDLEWATKKETARDLLREASPWLSLLPESPLRARICKELDDAA